VLGDSGRRCRTLKVRYSGDLALLPEFENCQITFRKSDETTARAVSIVSRPIKCNSLKPLIFSEQQSALLAR
jgi:hypothetical protein